MISRVCLGLCILVSVVGTQFMGGLIGEGDYRHLYPVVCLCIHPFENYSHSLSYVLGLVEGLRYPKDRIHVAFFLETNSESSSDVFAPVSRWSSELSTLYLTTAVKTSSSNWREDALTYSRSKSCAYALIMDSDAFLMKDSLKQLIDLNKVVVSPLLNAPFGEYSNVHNLLDEDFVSRKQLSSTRVYYSRGPILINLKHVDASYLSFDENNIPNYKGSGHPIDVLGFSAYAMDIPILMSNENFYGYIVDSAVHSPSKHRDLMNTFIANLISDTGPMPFPHSSVVEPQFPVATTFGFDKIFLINLKRRPERLRKMTDLAQLLGIDFTIFEAVDGQLLSEDEIKKLKFLPGYEDPYYKRPMKRGEIGCFLSHYQIWKEIVDNGLERVIVFEDDVRFTENATIVLRGTVEDMMKTQKSWDFIYLGRKKMTAPGDEFYVPGHQFLSTVSYSYWTLGYAISLSGAQKLLQSKPLEKLMALDEFLPIMYDKHPNQEWKNHFPVRNLDAYTVYPVVVLPERYTHEAGYVSDTEGSLILDKNAINSTSHHVNEQSFFIATEHNSQFLDQTESLKKDEL
ncbi:glycosyltransferase family 25 (LPS biosynthesis protein) domain-containing protein [Ditylenchus destructor]|uniref:Glycosyltransferase family 25 (LPS biosynthesis protein) domain-containing protein n=1 Tax=Ditylenchus destructor TaxID=166010 RepID=A0AAD4NMZ6_9BILA|nr:glycosyltransferase family 25 (LPS biosynthesis protein) domain-containing protein [Ditylenchus destructor]